MFTRWKFWKANTASGGNGPTGYSSSQVGRSSLPERFTSVEVAHRSILEGTAPEGLWTGDLKFEREPKLRHLPKHLTVAHLSISDCPNFHSLPENLWAGTVNIRNSTAFREVPSSVAVEHLELDNCPQNISFGEGPSLGSLRLRNYTGQLNFDRWLLCRDLVWNRAPLENLPCGLRVAGTLDLSDSRDLRRLPEQMKLDALILRQCPRLESLPDRLDARVVDVSDCTKLRWQDEAFVEVSDLNLTGCSQITFLPWWLLVQGSLDVANTGLKALPEGQNGYRLLWRGVEVDARIAFRPEQLQVKEVFAQRNSEVRRVMLERIGWERFLQEAKPKVRDRDYDPGGERRLLHVAFTDHEDLLVLCVKCPSTERQYFLRVPPHVTTCHQAAAWIAGFSEPSEYEPVLET